MSGAALLEAAEISRLFAALSDTQRIRIVNLLTAGEMCVCDVMEILELPQSTVSRHLGILRKDGVVHVQRRGRFAYYRLAAATQPWATEVVAGMCDAVRRAAALREERERADERLRFRLAQPCETD